MAARRLGFFLLLAAGPAAAAPPPKDSAAIPEGTVLAEPADLTDVQAVRARTKSLNNLRQIGLAFHKYHDTNDKFPQNVYDPNGKPLLSWRVLIVPYLVEGADKSVSEFRMDEPWDSKTNRALIEKMPDVFASPRVAVKAKGYTVYQVFAGKGAPFGSNQDIRFTSITDGTSNTILAVEATAAVPWTKPADVPFDPDKDLPDFGKAFGGKPAVALCDGSARVLDTKKISMATLKAAVTHAGDEVLGTDW